MSTLHIVTGANGYLGSHVAFSLLSSRPQDRVLCIARSDDACARDRVIDAISAAAHTCGEPLAHSALDRFQVVDGNPLRDTAMLTERLKGVVAEADAATFWHIAATVRFTEKEAGELDRINTAGAESALQIAIDAGCDTFNYVSTAYVAGSRDGVIEERIETNPPETFSNPYERSKFKAEHLVSSRAAQAGLHWRIMRPSIILGHSRTLLSSSDNGIYGFCEMLSEFWSGMQKAGTTDDLTLRVAVPAGAHQNCVPVDVCVDEMLAIDAQPSSRNRVFHCVSATPILTAESISAAAEATGVPLQVVEPEELLTSPLSQLETEFARRVFHYRPYMCADKRFDRAQTILACGKDLQAGHPVNRQTMLDWIQTFLQRRSTLRHASPEARLFTQQHALPARFNFAGHLLTTAALEHPNRVALRHSGESIRYAELSARVAACVHRLCAAGVHGQQRIALVSHDSIAHVATMLAIQYLGAVAVMINPLLPSRDIARMLIQADARFAVSDAATISKFEESGSQVPTLLLEAIAAPGGETALPLMAPTSPHDAAFVVFTSGSMGVPKLIEHRHQDPIVAADRYAAHLLYLRPSDVLFSASRTTFAFGLQNLLIALLNGANAVIAPQKITAEVIANVIASERPTIMFAVPTVYQYLLDDPELSARISNNSLRLCIAAGERLPREIASRWFQHHGIRLLDSLGSTEAFSTYLSNVADVEQGSATGKLIPGFDAVLRHEDGLPCGNGERGVMWLRGPSLSVSEHDRVASGRYQRGWYCTNDVFWRDADGYFHFCGRSDEMFKVAGQWVSPLDMEEVLSAHPLVREVAVTSSGCDETGTLRTKAWVVSANPSEALADDLRGRCKTQLDARRYPHLIEFVDALPRTSTGKLQRTPLRQRSAEQSAASDATSAIA